MPDIYATIETAQMSGVEPWALDTQSVYWQAHMREYHVIHHQVAQEQRKREERKRLMQGRRR